MDIEAKKVQVQEDIARQPANVVFARIDIVNEIQLADLMKAEFIPYFRGTARSVSSGTTGNSTDTLHAVCVNLAKQRALLQGAAASDVIHFNIHSATFDGTGNITGYHNSNTAPYTTNGDLTFPTLEDASYSNKTSIPFTVLHDLNADGGIVTLSSTSNANTEIADDDGNNVKYFTDFSKYFLTRSRANGELITIDENNAPYTTPTVAEPFVPANTINGETYTGTATDPTANSDVRHDFFLTANTTAVGFAGANNDITENKYEGNTFVTIALSNVSGTFSVDETITDFDGSTATIKTASNTTTLLIETSDAKGTFTVGETLTDLSTNATIQTVETVSNTEINITLTGSTFLTGSNTSLDLGFTTANTITLDENTVVRTGSKVVVTANDHGVSSGDYIVLKGATDDFSEFNDTFVIDDVTQNTLTFTTSNSVSVTPTGDFSLMKNIVVGRTSNASAAIHTRTVNSSANVVFQSANLSVGFPVANLVTGSASSANGVIDSRTIGGAWYQLKTNEVKTYYAASDSGTWDYDATNNPQGIESTANTGEFWLKNNEMVRINQLVAGTNAGTSTETAPKMVLDISLATSSDKSGGYDSTIDTQVPGAYFAYPLKTYEDQVHDGVTTLEAFDNFANVVIAPEGLEINFDWKPLANSSGVATNSTHINADGSVTNSSFNPEEVTTLNKSDFEAHLANYTTSSTNDVFLSSDPDVKSSGAKVGTSGAVYPSVNNNPFFPAVNGTHKNNTDTENDLTGTQPGTLNANSIYAGGYTEEQKGATEPDGDFRYRIWNDIKWTYGTNPHATGASKSGAYNVPRESGTGATQGDFLDAYDGYTNTLNAQLNSVTNDTPSGTTDAARTAANFQLAAGASSITAASGTNTPVDTTLKLVNATSGLYGSIVVTSTHSGTGGGSVSYSTGSFTEIDCFNNFCIKILTDGAIVPSGTFSLSSSEYQTNVVILNTLLTNLTASSTSNTAYVDPVAHALGGSRIITDAAFETSIGNLKTELSDFVSVFNSEIIAIKAAGATVTGSGTAPSIPNCITTTDYSPAGFGGSDPNRTSNLYTAYSNYKTQLATTRTDITKRITEISNRIGYVNSKDVAIGGIDSGTTTKSKDGTLTKQGFEGYTFNGGKGYANTIYSHANFLAGKKIKLFEKIITAINDVQALYDQVKSKRSQYYEYNQ